MANSNSSPINSSRPFPNNPTRNPSFSLEEVLKQAPNRLSSPNDTSPVNTSTTISQDFPSLEETKNLNVNSSSPDLSRVSTSTALSNGSSTSLLNGTSTGLLNGTSTGLFNGTSTGLLNGTSTDAEKSQIENEQKRPSPSSIPEELRGENKSTQEPPQPPIPGQESEQIQQNSGNRINPSPLTFLPQETKNQPPLPSDRESINPNNQTTSPSSPERTPEDTLIPDLNHQKGTPKADQLLGTDNNDLLRGLRGDDSLYGGVGSDVINGAKGNDYLDAYLVTTNSNSTSVSNRQPEIDILIGGKGSDTFVLGSSSGSYYYEGSPDTTSTSQVPDFAIIKDFNPNFDTLVLAGKAQDFTIEEGTMEQYLPSGINGEGIPNILDTFILKNGDLIAVLPDRRQPFTLDQGVTFI